jgi:hypothetical protein
MMMWLLLIMLVCTTIVVAGRAHSRYLDRLDEKNTWLFVADQRLQVVRQNRNENAADA